jgi:hypothetical protein
LFVCYRIPNFKTTIIYSLPLKCSSPILSFLLFTSAIRILAQSSGQVDDSVSALFTKFRETNTDKSIVLLTSRNIFMAGEKVWFRAYNVTTRNGRPDLKSKNLFADLVNEEDSTIEQIVLDNSGLHTEGAFFPERLTAIPGIISTGVIEIRDGYNNPLSVKGDLLNSKDSLITPFQTNSLGLARLTFVNDPAENYRAVFYVNDQATRYQLPAVEKTSIQLSVVNQTAKTIKAIVTLEDSVPADTHTTILAIQRDSLYWAAVGTSNYGVTIPIENFPGGLVRLLLFDGDKNLVSERKIYIPKESVELEAEPGKKKYSGRESVNVHIKIKDPGGEPLVSLLNVGVEDERIQKFSDSLEAATLPPPGEFLLDNWLSRYHSKYSADDIDLLLATRSSIFPQSPGAGLDPEIRDYDDNKKLLNFQGKIVNRKGNGISNRIVNAMANNSRQFFMDVDTTDKDGKFSLSIPQGFDSLKLSLQITDKHLVQMPSDSIKIEDFQYPNFSTPSSLKQQSLFNNFNALAVLKKYHRDTASFFQGVGWLPPVTLKAVKKVEPNYDVSRRLSSISQILPNDKIRYAANAEGVINALRMVPGVSEYYGDLAIFGTQ